MKETTFYIDEKVTVWRRTHYKIDEELDDNSLIAAINGQSKDYPNLQILHSDLIKETENGVTPDRNNNEATMLVFNADEKLIWSNSK